MVRSHLHRSRRATPGTLEHNFSDKRKDSNFLAGETFCFYRIYTEYTIENQASRYQRPLFLQSATERRFHETSCISLRFSENTAKDIIPFSGHPKRSTRNSKTEKAAGINPCRFVCTVLVISSYSSSASPSSAATGVSVPNSPFTSPSGPAVKNRVVAGPELAFPAPN